MGIAEDLYRKRKQLELKTKVDYTEDYYKVALPIKDSLPKIAEFATLVLPEKYEIISCGGLHYVGWYITDTFVPDYIPGLNRDDDLNRNWIFLIAERYRDTPALVCTFLPDKNERIFKELFEINLNSRTIKDPKPELNFNQLLKVKAGLDRFSAELGLLK